MRSPRRLQVAQENGFLNARCLNRTELLRVYGLWCWRMAIPMVWYERRSPHSRFSRVHLEMLTTPCTLTVAGRAALIATSAKLANSRHAAIEAHSAVWDRVPPHAAADFARAVFRAIRRSGNQQLQPGRSVGPLVAEQAIRPAALLPTSRRLKAVTLIRIPPQAVTEARQLG